MAARNPRTISTTTEQTTKIAVTLRLFQNSGFWKTSLNPANPMKGRGSVGIMDHWCRLI